MTHQTNLSDKNAFCRFAMGTSMTAFGIAKAARQPDCMTGRWMIILGAMKMAEGIFKYCPTKAMLGANIQGEANGSMSSMLSGQNFMSSEQVSQLMKDFSAAISGKTSETTATKQSDKSTSSNTANPS
ncbi:YgaP-like transmembrane domain [Lysinibacillus piscis]|uniref:Inner membrane protein YgaP-like transmembrane domain-containing protein n=1 Tax=Lysinibacillus piscis TaxID=2518931 RepID=A0ABQ5NQZ2_9BACI|nr:YgaP-like transmembrane domain [Lysinibacillus sp. KH24]GLC90439.1 hypothetical protein LYSBPC_35660 [Lysinibacillus sp. KH24]